MGCLKCKQKLQHYFPAMVFATSFCCGKLQTYRKMLSNTQRQVNFNHLNLNNINHKAPYYVGSRTVQSSNDRVASPKRWGIVGFVLAYEKQNKIKCSDEILHHIFL